MHTSVHRRWAGKALSAVLALAFLLDQAPAGLAAGPLAKASRGRAALAETNGTLWHGGGQLLALSNEQQARNLTRLRWDFQPGALKQLELSWQISFDGQPGARLALSLSGLRVEAMKVNLPATSLEPWIAGLLPVRGLSGWLQLQAKQWRCDWALRACSGGSELQWTGARIASISDVSLGSFVLSLDREGGDTPWRYALLTQSGLIALTVSGEADAQRATLTGTARPAAEAPAKLQQWLAALGPRQGDTTQIKLSFPLGPKVGSGGTAPQAGAAS